MGNNIVKPVIKNKQETQQQTVDLDKIPDELKKIVKCQDCNGTIFSSIHRWTKVDCGNGEYTYVVNHRSMCIECKKLLPEQP